MAIQKSQNFRLKELFYSLNILKDCLKLVEGGKVYQMIPVYGQLRSLLHIPKNTNSDTKPLLITLADELQINTDFYFRSLKALYDCDDLLKDTVISFHSLGFSLSEQFGLEKTNIVDFLSEEIFIFEGKKYTIKKMFQTFSDKFGGAHYDKSIPDEFEKLYPLETKDIHILNKQILDFAELVIRCGTRILKKTNDFDIIFCVELPQTNTNKSCIFYSTNELSTITLEVNENSFNLIVLDELQNLRTIELDYKIIENMRYYITISHCINEELNSELTIKINDFLVFNDVLPGFYLHTNTLFDRVLFNYTNNMYQGVDVKLFQCSILLNIDRIKFDKYDQVAKKCCKSLTEFQNITNDITFEMKMNYA